MCRWRRQVGPGPWGRARGDPPATGGARLRASSVCARLATGQAARPADSCGQRTAWARQPSGRSDACPCGVGEGTGRTVQGSPGRVGAVRGWRGQVPGPQAGSGAAQSEGARCGPTLLPDSPHRSRRRAWGDRSAPGICAPGLGAPTAAQHKPVRCAGPEDAGTLSPGGRGLLRTAAVAWCPRGACACSAPETRSPVPAERAISCHSRSDGSAARSGRCLRPLRRRAGLQSPCRAITLALARRQLPETAREGALLGAALRK